MQRRVLLHFSQKIRENQKGQRQVRCSPRRPQQRTRSGRAASSVPPVSTVVGMSYFHLSSTNKKVSATERSAVHRSALGERWIASDCPGPIRCSGGFCCTFLKIRENQKGQGRYAARRDVRSGGPFIRGAASSVPPVSTVVGMSYFHLSSTNKKVSATERSAVHRSGPRRPLDCQRLSRPDPMQRRVLLHFSQKVRENQKGQRQVRCSPRRPQQRTRSARCGEQRTTGVNRRWHVLFPFKFNEQKS